MWNWQKILIKWNSMDLHHNAYYQHNYSLVKDKTKCTHLKILSSNILLEQKNLCQSIFLTWMFTYGDWQKLQGGQTHDAFQLSYKDVPLNLKILSTKIDK